MLKKLSFFLFALAIYSFGASISQNIQFKDLEGNSYDLFEELDRGVHVYVHMTFNG